MPRSRGRAQVDLVGADAEAADRQQVRGSVEHLLGDLGVGPDAEQGHVVEGLDQLVLRERLRAQLHLEAAALEHVDGGGVDVLQEQGLHVVRLCGPPGAAAPSPRLALGAPSLAMHIDICQH